MNNKNWPADKVERRELDKLIPYARNSRTHSDEQVAQIAASIKEWGWTVPILIDENGGIIAGHGRVLAARKLGLKDVPVMVAAGWSEAQKRAYVLADNKLALNAGWDLEMLGDELQDLSGDFGELSGFSEKELLDMFAVGEDQLPEQKELKATFEVAVECSDEYEQETVYNLLCKKGYRCRILTM